MAILADKNTRLLIQGITGREGSYHAQQMIAYGTAVVGGVTPGKGGEWFEGSVPVFDTVKEAKESTGANATCIFVPPRFAADAVFEAIDAGVELIVCITEGIPIADMMRVRAYLDNSESRLVGANCPGILTPGQAKIGIIPGYAGLPGNVGIVSKSGTLTYEVMSALSQRGIGQSTCVGIGGDPVNGTNFIDVLQLFEDDPQTDKVVLIGEIGGDLEQQAAQFIRDKMTKPVVSFIAGKAAPEGRTMGHAGALIEAGRGTHAEKVAALKAANVKVADNPEQIPDLL
ncbi:MAG: succinate--CoA ligase subunit alpha [Anaerolineae bacterium]|nr:succinate--CoA ligase subunit alpha [Anaerolineae bacterium]